MSDSPKEISGVRPQNPLHGDRLGRRDIDLDIACAKRCRDFKTDEARADHNSPPRVPALGDKSAAVGERAQIMHMRKAAAGNVKPHRFGAGGEEKRVIRQFACISEPQLTVCGVDCGNAGREPEINPMLLVKTRRSQWNPVRFRRAGEETLGKVRAIVGSALIGAQQRYATGKALLPERFGGGIARRAASHNDDAPRHVLRGTRAWRCSFEFFVNV